MLNGLLSLMIVLLCLNVLLLIVDRLARERNEARAQAKLIRVLERLERELETVD